MQCVPLYFLLFYVELALQLGITAGHYLVTEVKYQSLFLISQTSWVSPLFTKAGSQFEQKSL